IAAPYSLFFQQLVIPLLGVAKHKRGNAPPYPIEEPGTSPYIYNGMPYPMLTTPGGRLSGYQSFH
ncbi:MAG: hypothetical protein ACETWB_07230, partial [Anaerolineae bacterium]